MKVEERNIQKKIDWEKQESFKYKIIIENHRK